jgi:hypothetical protein
MILALLEARDRNGNLLGCVPVTRWPVTVGRALSNDLVLDDAHLAASHLSVNRAPDGGPVSVEVLDTLNGVTLRRHRHGRGERFDWPEGQELTVGRLHFVLRLAEAPLAPEQPLPRFAWSRAAVTVSLLALMFVLQLGQGWLGTDESRRFWQQLPFVLAYLLGSVLLWAGLWALATRLFTGQMHFWRHVRIACATFVATQVVMSGSQVLGGMFSWELLARFAWIGAIVAAAAGLFAHLHVIAPRRRNLLAGSMTVLVLLGVGGLIGSTWMQTKRLSNELYMASLLPPSWRLAPAVPVPEFIEQAQGLKARVDARLADQDDENAATADDTDSDEE